MQTVHPERRIPPRDTDGRGGDALARVGAKRPGRRGRGEEVGMNTVNVPEGFEDG